MTGLWCSNCNRPSFWYRLATILCLAPTVIGCNDVSATAPLPRLYLNSTNLRKTNTPTRVLYGLCLGPGRCSLVHYRYGNEIAGPVRLLLVVQKYAVVGETLELHF